MFDVLFGWRKASKCKKLIKRVQSRLKLLKSKRCSIVRQLREDVVQLIRIGYQDIAFNRAEHLFQDENIVAVMDCWIVSVNSSFFTCHISAGTSMCNVDCPNDINEAVSSLIFASARCGDLPELRRIRKLFGERYGLSFEKTALELLPGNLVNLQVKEKLSAMSVPDEVKYRLVDEIMRDYYLRAEIFALEYTSTPQQQGKDHGILFPEADNHVRRSEVFQEEASEINDRVVVKSILVDPGPSRPEHYDTISDSTGHLVHQSSPDSLESPDKADSNDKSKKPDRFYISSPGCKEERKTMISSSESLPQLPEEMIVYVDDIVEVSSSIGTTQDQRTFRFTSSPLLRHEKDQCVDHQYESGIGRPCSGTCSRHGLDTAKKKPRRRSVSGTRGTDMDSSVYYDKPSKKASHQNYRKMVTEKPETRKQYKPDQCFDLGEEKTCSLNRPCYFCPDGCEDDHHGTKQKLPYNSRHFQAVVSESDTDMERYTFPDKLRTAVKHQPERTPTRHPSITTEAKPPYSRAMTMPQERAKDRQRDNVSRSKSFPVQSPNHVHPKLPDYDDIAEKFMALKRQNLQNRCHGSFTY